MDIKDIRKIIEMMKQNELSEFELQDEGFRIAIKRRHGEESKVMVSPPPMAHAPHLGMPPAAVAPSAETQPGVAPAEDPGETIRSPMVGTFYRAPSPESDSAPDAPRWSRLRKAVSAWLTMAWLASPVRVATNATPQASCS